jgi:hypothetical protein
MIPSVMEKRITMSKAVLPEARTSPYVEVLHGYFEVTGPVR